MSSLAGMLIGSVGNAEGLTLDKDHGITEEGGSREILSR